MVSTKAVKRKTVWRTLAIGAEAAGTTAAATGDVSTPELKLASSSPATLPGANSAIGGDLGALAASANVVTATAVSSTNPTSASATSTISNTTNNNNNIAGGGSHPQAHHNHRHNQQHPQQSQQKLRQTSNSNYYDGRSKPFTSYNRHSSATTSTASQSHSKFNRRSNAPTAEARAPASAGSEEPVAVTGSDANTAAATNRWNNTGNGPRHVHSGNRGDRFAGRHTGTATSSAPATGSSSGVGFRRRPYNPRYYNGSTRSTFRIHRTDAQQETTESAIAGDDKDVDGDSTRPRFNEDDYTRITTPRQDVLFKKGYLSRPKPYASAAIQVDPVDSGLEEVIVLTPEEAIAAGLMHGYDPEHPYIGYYDATGMFYVNPYMNVGGATDPYTGEMMMMPPYNEEAGACGIDGAYPTDISAPEQPYTLPSSDDCSNYLAVSGTCDLNGCNIGAMDGQTVAEFPTVDQPAVVSAEEGQQLSTSSSEQSQSGDEPISTDESQGGATSKGDEGDGEETTPDVTIDGSATDAPTSNIPAFYPQIFYPYIFGAPAPYVPVNDYDGQSYGNPYESSQGKFNRYRRRKRKPFRYPSSTGTTTTDYSEDDEHTEQTLTLDTTQNNFLTDGTIDEVLLRTNLHADCTEFVPREFSTEEYLSPNTPPPSPTPSIVRNTTLNVHVPEFRPRAAQCSTQSFEPKTITINHDSDDSGVSTTEVQPSAPNTPEPRLLIDASDFPSIGVASALETVSENNDQQVKQNAWSYAAIAQRQVAEMSEPPVTEIAETDTPLSNKDVALKAVESESKKSNIRNSVSSAKKGPTGKLKAKPKEKSNKARPTKRSEPRSVESDDLPIQIIDSEVQIVTPTTEVCKPKTSVPSFADLLRPAVVQPVLAELTVKRTSPIAEVEIKQKIEVIEPITISAVETAEEIIVETVQPTWHTIRVGKKKRMVQHDEPADFWDEPEPEPELKPERVVEPTVVKEPEIEVPTDDLTQLDDHIEAETDPAESIKQVKSRKTKSKKPVKKVIIKTVTVKKEFKSAEIAQSESIDVDLAEAETLQKDVTSDMVEYNFVADPNAIFANAIAPSAMFGNGKFDFALKSPQAKATLRLEEDMVMRIMRSISQVEDAKSVNEELNVEKQLLNNVVEQTPQNAEIIVENNIGELVEDDGDSQICIPEIKQIIDVGNVEQNVEYIAKVLNDKTGDTISQEVECKEIKQTINGFGNGININTQQNGHEYQHIKDTQTNGNGSAVKLNGHYKESHKEGKTNAAVDTESAPIANGYATSTNGIHKTTNGCNVSHPAKCEAPTSNGTSTIGISSISLNGNMNGNTIESHDDIAIDDDFVVVVDDDVGMTVTNQLQITTTPDDARPTLDSATGSVPSDLSDDASTLSSLDDTEDEREEDDDDDDDDERDDRTVIGALDGYIEDALVDADNLLSCGEFYVGHTAEQSLDPLSDGDIDELIKQAEFVVGAKSPAALSTQSSFDDYPDIEDIFPSHKHKECNESPHSSKDSGILESQDETIGTPTEQTETGNNGLLDGLQAPKGSLTLVVSQWLVEKQKEKSPEPIIRLPQDPVLSTQIEKSLQRFQIAEMLKTYSDDYGDDEDVDDDDDDGEYDEEEADYAEAIAATTKAPKNLQSNPLPVSSVNQPETSKRVASNNTNNTNNTVPLMDSDEPDILEYWDVDPMLNKRANCETTAVNYAQLLSEVGTRTTIDFLMSQQQQKASSEKTTSPIDTKSGEYLKRHKIGCALM